MAARPASSDQGQQTKPASGSPQQAKAWHLSRKLSDYWTLATRQVLKYLVLVRAHLLKMHRDGTAAHALSDYLNHQSSPESSTELVSEVVEIEMRG